MTGSHKAGQGQESAFFYYIIGSEDEGPEMEGAGVPGVDISCTAEG